MCGLHENVIVSTEIYNTITDVLIDTGRDCDQLLYVPITGAMRYTSGTAVR